MIRSFANRDAERLWRGEPVRGMAEELRRRALMKLRQLDAAGSLNDLRIPPGNRLEALQGDRRGQYSIRVDRQWRVCFRWHDGHAEAVEIVDYH